MKLLLFVLSAVVGAATATATSLDSNCIVGCNCKSYENGTKIQIKRCDRPITLTNDTFPKKSELTSLHIENAKILTIDASAFRTIQYLEEFSMQDCTVGNIHPRAFDLPELNLLMFTRVTFAHVPALAGENLEEIAFKDCGLRDIPNFDRAPNLAYINLDNNQIVNVSENAFANLSGLEQLSMVNNSIVKLPPNVFDNNNDLNTLILDHNPLEYFSLSSPSLNLEEIYLTHCKISVFDRSSSKNLELVTLLDLSHNEISILPLDAFNGMKELQYLYISHNKLVELDDDIFIDNEQLQRIIFDHNNFKRLPKFQTSGKVFETNYFSCNHCGLKSVDNSFDNMQMLITLNLNNNQITNIDNAFVELRELKEVQLSNNSISAVRTGAFAKRNRIEMLNLSGNPLKPLDPVVFANFPELRKLDISHSNLTKIWSNHNAKLSSVERLLVGKNALQSVTVDDLKILPKLKLMDLTANPLTCSDDLRDVIAYLIKNEVYSIEGATELKTHEALLLADPENPKEFDLEKTWKGLVINSCFTAAGGMKVYEQDVNKAKYEVETTQTTDSYEDSYDDDNEELSYDNDEEIIIAEPNVEEPERNVVRASYILSITSVFALTALAVLSIAVAITLLVLKKNTNYANHGNLPRLKMPKWHTPSLQKKHCGSVYKPLSEEHITTIDYKFQPAPIHNNTIP